MVDAAGTLGDGQGDKHCASTTNEVVGGEGIPTTSVIPNVSQVSVPGSISTEALRAAWSRALPVLPKLPLNSLPRLPAKSSRASILQGPIPQRGSGQDRFRQLLKENRPSGTTNIAKSGNLFTMPPGTTQYFMAAQPLVCTTTSSSQQEVNYPVPPPLSIKPRVPEAEKLHTEESCLSGPKSMMGDAAGPKNHKAAAVGVDKPYHHTALQRLSAQCQQRGFNPIWHNKSLRGGFTCSVQILDKHIRGQRIWRTEREAKLAVAEKALAHIRNLPHADPAGKAAALMKDAREMLHSKGLDDLWRTSTSEMSAAGAGQEDSGPRFTNTAAPTATPNWNTSGYSQQSSTVNSLQSLFGDAGPSPAILSNPFAAQAFLQGLAVGSTVRAVSSAYERRPRPQNLPLPAVTGDLYRPGSSRNFYRPYDERERSPTRFSDREYRDRSSPRRRMAHESNSQRSDSRDGSL